MPRLHRFIAPLFLAAFAAHAADPYWVVGQSLDLGPMGDGTGRRVQAGAKAYIESVNAQGGIQGVPVRLVTLNDDGSPERHAANLRRLLDDDRAIALLNCVGDVACAAAVPVATASGVPLVGALAGSKRIQLADSPQLFLIRPGYAQEAAAIARQLKAMGISRLAVLSQQAADPERGALLAEAARSQAITLLPIAVSPGPAESLRQAVAELGKSNAQAVLFDVPAQTVELMFGQGLATRPEWPPVLVTYATGTLNPLVAGFKDRVVMFANVVPNPERGNLPLTLDLQRHTDMHSEGPAVSFAGLEGYVGARLLVEGLRRCVAPCSRARLASALRGIKALDLGGFQLGYGDGRRAASTYVDVTVRSRNGAFLN
jgi:ABC-type branched-subunit amino acid transport system substrate-binding protein